MRPILLQCVGFLIITVRALEGRPQDGYRSNCKATQVNPGIWYFTCTPPDDDKITISHEHIVQFKQSDLSDMGPKEINVDVPNYKIRQIIRPQIVEDEGVTATALTVNIQLLTPDVQTNRQDTENAGHAVPPQLPPVVNINYPPVNTEKNHRESKTPFEIDPSKDYDTNSGNLGKS